MITEKEIAVVELMADDNRPTQIAQILKISQRTVESRIERMKLKLGLKTTHGLVSYFLRKKLIE